MTALFLSWRADHFRPSFSNWIHVGKPLCLAGASLCPLALGTWHGHEGTSMRDQGQSYKMLSRPGFKNICLNLGFFFLLVEIWKQTKKLQPKCEMLLWCFMGVAVWIVHTPILLCRLHIRRDIVHLGSMAHRREWGHQETEFSWGMATAFPEVCTNDEVTWYDVFHNLLLGCYATCVWVSSLPPCPQNRSLLKIQNEIRKKINFWALLFLFSFLILNRTQNPHRLVSAPHGTGFWRWRVGSRIFNGKLSNAWGYHERGNEVRSR